MQKRGSELQSQERAKEKRARLAEGNVRARERGEKWKQWLKISDTGIAGQGQTGQNRPKNGATLPERAAPERAAP